MKWSNSTQKAFIESIFIMALVGLFLLILRVFLTGVIRFAFIPWNLLLAFIPLGLAILLRRDLLSFSKLTPRIVILGLVWLALLPNTWYVLTDFVHVQPTGDITIFYDIVMMLAFVMAGMAAGFMALYEVHTALVKRFKGVFPHVAAGLIIALSSFGMYLGRDLRWNTWDIITNPAGLLLDVSDRFADPVEYPRFVVLTLLFMTIIGSCYFTIYRVAMTLHSQNKK